MRLIDADAMKEELLWGNVYLSDNETNALVDLIDNQPTIDLESLRPRGHWEGFQADGKDDLFDFTLKAINICSKCKHISMQKSKYCPHCGARMED